MNNVALQTFLAELPRELLIALAGTAFVAVVLAGFRALRQSLRSSVGSQRRKSARRLEALRAEHQALSAMPPQQNKKAWRKQLSHLEDEILRQSRALAALLEVPITEKQYRKAAVVDFGTAILFPSLMLVLGVLTSTGPHPVFQVVGYASFGFGYFAGLWNLARAAQWTGKYHAVRRERLVTAGAMASSTPPEPAFGSMRKGVLIAIGFLALWVLSVILYTLSVFDFA